jgi:diguanylate cyclase (GGDEF)-like protein/PAS domain S-box-containing protein
MVDISTGDGLDGVTREDAVPIRAHSLRRRGPPAALPADAEARLRMIELTAQEGILSVDARNRVTYANQVVSEMLGYPVAEMVGSDLFRFTDDEGRQTTLANLNRRRRDAVTKFDVRCTHRDGSDVWVSIRATPVIADDGDYLGALATVVDVSSPHTAALDLILAKQVTLSIATTEDSEAALREVLKGIALADGNWGYAEAWLPNESDDSMALAATWSGDGTTPLTTRRFPTIHGADYVARVRAAAMSHRLDDLDTLTGDGPCSTLAVPVKAGEDVVAVLVLFAMHRFPPDERRVRRIESLVSQLGAVLARKRSEYLQVASDRRFHEFIDHMPAVVYMKDVEGQIILRNRRATELWDEEAEAEEDARDELLIPLHATKASRDNDAGVVESASAHTFLETAELADGLHWYSSIKFPVFDTTGDVYGVGAITRDITDRRKVDEELSEAYRQLERRALYDSLTGLPNRAHLLERLASLERSGLLATALIFVDLDDFKDVNDTHGHAAGDQLLRTAAARMRTCIRPSDVLARLGGDEFAVLLEGADTVAAESLAQRIVDAMNTPFDVGGQQSSVTASVGIAVGTVADTKPDELLRYADLAMYEAKSKGKGRFASFDGAMSDALVLRTRTENELREAINSGGLELYYQPIVDLASGEMVGVEALVRWQHPVRGLLGPDEFVPLAERSGLIVDLGAWVLHDACHQASKWQAARGDRRGLFMSVNVSARQLDDPVFVTTVSDALERTRLDPAALCLEITETAVMANPDRAQQAVQPLQDLGVQLAIDDFGTGYASLTYLRRLRAGAVKIDRSFVDGLGREHDDTTIVSAVIGLAHAMGLSVTAEGIETAEQLLILRDMGCQNAQGYLMCPAVPADVLTRQLERRWLDVDVPGHRDDDRPPRSNIGNTRLRVVVADDSEHDRNVVRGAIEAGGHFEVVGEANDAESAVQMTAARRPHVVLVDSKITGAEGLAAVPRILLAAPGALVVLLSDAGAAPSIDHALAVGAAACYEKSVPDLGGEVLALARQTA